MIPKTIVIRLNEKQRDSLIEIFMQYKSIKKNAIYSNILDAGISFILGRDGRWEEKKNQ